MSIHSDFNSIKKAWSAYVKDGIVPVNIPKEIVDSWIRCKAKKLNPFEIKRTPSVSEKNFQNRLDKNKMLLDVSIPFMKEIQEFVNKSGYSTTLADSNGVILEMICAPSILAQSFEFNLVRGSIWNEHLAGTNATGLTIALKKPIQIIGAEHYFECYHNLTCSAAPIFDEQNRLIGVLDMSGPKELSYPHTLGMVVAASKAITRQLCIAESNRQIELTNHYLRTLIDYMDEGVVAVDVKGKIIGINSQGAKILQTTTFDSFGKNILDIMEGDTILSGTDSMKTEEQHVITKSNKINCLINSQLILYENGEVAGAVARLTDMKKIKVKTSGDKHKKLKYTFEDIIGESSSIRRAINLSKIAANGNSTVLLQGESGTGKEMFAQAIHNAFQEDKPFVAINCSAITESLIESTLFGYDEGAFTGASKQGKKGKFELAEGGTIFLDEIGDMPLQAQATLLRVIQERTIQRIGGSEDIPINVRIIAATNKNLSGEMKKGKFRQDLFYRLNVLEINIPPLRNRKGDLSVLSEYFIEEISQKFKKSILLFKASTLEMLETYQWPGNVRQFKNAIEQAIYFTESNRIDEYFISDYLPHQDLMLENLDGEINRNIQYQSENLHPLRKIEQDAIKEALDLFSERKKAAEHLGISRSTLYRKIKEYNLGGVNEKGN